MKTPSSPRRLAACKSVWYINGHDLRPLRRSRVLLVGRAGDGSGYGVIEMMVMGVDVYDGDG